MAKRTGFVKGLFAGKHFGLFLLFALLLALPLVVYGVSQSHNMQQDASYNGTSNCSCLSSKHWVCSIPHSSHLTQGYCGTGLFCTTDPEYSTHCKPDCSKLSGTAQRNCYLHQH